MNSFLKWLSEMHHGKMKTIRKIYFVLCFTRPLGATMVGIHPRPGREKIASKHVAHVLNDETQRKYIQAVKRLVSRAQKLYPADPSRCVDYGQRNDNVTIIPTGDN